MKRATISLIAGLIIIYISSSPSLSTGQFVSKQNRFKNILSAHYLDTDLIDEARSIITDVQNSPSFKSYAKDMQRALEQKLHLQELKQHEKEDTLHERELKSCLKRVISLERQLEDAQQRNQELLKRQKTAKAE